MEVTGIKIVCADCGHDDHMHRHAHTGTNSGGFVCEDWQGCSCKNTFETVIESYKKSMNEPELQLLIIDMGDCCVVKVEQGRWDGGKLLCRGGRTDSVKVFYEPFTVLREAIEQKPVPRIEADLTDDYRVFVSETEVQSEPICRETYNALSQLAGKPLPVWSGGTWTEVVRAGNMVEGYPQTDFSVWRYER